MQHPADAIKLMEKLQIAKFGFLLLFLLFIPFVSSSLRPSYLYLLLNLLIVALGVEAGFLSGAPHKEKKQIVASFVPAAPAAVAPDATFGLGSARKREEKAPGQKHHHHCELDPVKIFYLPAKPLEPKSSVAEEEVGPAAATARTQKSRLKRYPSRPSLFFIGGPDPAEAVDGRRTTKELDGDYEEERWEEAAGVLSKQELFAKSETFIGNFYKQLKMQREESWKKIHGLYHLGVLGSAY